jgi:hypothetical protein
VSSGGAAKLRQDQETLKGASVAFARLRELGGVTALVKGADGVERIRVETRLYENINEAADAADRAIAARIDSR